MSDLANALEKLQLSAADTADDWVDHLLEEQQRPRKRIKQGQEELKRELEQKFLTPSKSFSPEWLNRLQQYALCPSWTLETTLTKALQTLGSPHRPHRPLQARPYPNSNNHTIHTRRPRGTSHRLQRSHSPGQQRDSEELYLLPAEACEQSGFRARGGGVLSFCAWWIGGC